VDPQITVAAGQKKSTFDQLEDMDTGVCLDKMVKLSAMNPANAAFVFIKPHAVTDKVKRLARATLLEKGMRIVAEGHRQKEADRSALLRDRFEGDDPEAA
jgi:hypothetical protein